MWMFRYRNTFSKNLSYMQDQTLSYKHKIFFMLFVEFPYRIVYLIRTYSVQRMSYFIVSSQCFSIYIGVFAFITHRLFFFLKKKPIFNNKQNHTNHKFPCKIIMYSKFWSRFHLRITITYILLGKIQDTPRCNNLLIADFQVQWRRLQAS